MTLQGHAHATAISAISALLIGMNAGAQPRPDELFQALGGREGIARLSADVVPRLFADPRIKHFFKDANAKNLVEQLSDQLCAASGGPCTYEGGAMKAVHADMAIKAGDFNAVVEDLQAAMDAAQIPFATQNRLLALLAPMHRDIVKR
ncbi:group 1 truncated hemoglobin [Paucibacter sp. APW11]|uniref:Group 1 truncated hemoglobin n=1 Tax=Roseateles aquae TaxID=3077235 RepID=A0ABU3PCK0_9BURK|nr:group 1 truncated hemoglobin [Paucibacter sp. APW11]MDT8999581.1 group 1 truncated hemoglobin [Paucibacter sp. APW11]